MSSTHGRRRPGRGTIGELAFAVSDGLRRTSAYSVLFNQAVAERLGINATDLRCLGLIGSEGPMTAGRLAELTSLTTGAITGVIDRLEKAGLAERRPDPSDRRRVIVVAAPGAMQRVGPLFDSLAQAIDDYCSRFTVEQLATIVEFVNGLEPIMREETAKARAAQKRDVDAEDETSQRGVST